MTPNERKTLHLEGTVENVLYCNPDNGYTVLELDADGTLVTVVGEMGETEEGERLSVDGEYTTHPPFRHAVSGTVLGTQAAGRCLQYPAIPFLRCDQRHRTVAGEKNRGKLRGQNAGDHGKGAHPSSGNSGHLPEKCEAIAAEVRQIFSLRTLMLFLSQYDIRSKYAMRAYQHWGTGAMDMLAANPYLLCSSGVELDFQKADAVAQGMQFAHNAPQRIQAGICYILQYNTNGGNACLPLDRLRPTACKYLQVNEAEFEIAYAAALEDHTLYVYEKNGRDFVYLEDYYIAERYIADRIGVIQDFSAPEDQEIFEKMIDAQQQEQGMQYAALQRKAIVTALSRSIMILTGGPGTGKTTTLNAIIELYEKQGYRVMIAAPTGRAASRISDLTGYEASTIHRMLAVEYDMSGNMRFQHNEHNPLDCDVMIVDEMSMVDVLLFEHLLRALRLSCKVVLVGDCDQLPSVEPAICCGI